jgi:hypothetical protein
MVGAGSTANRSFLPAKDPISEYWLDACQRAVLFLDVLRQRGNNALEYSARAAPNILSFSAELVLDGRKLERPVAYGLVRIIPPPGMVVDNNKRPFIVFDPRAGHGPGIGGMKHDSEIGEALAAGNPCYFVGFLPNPMPGQTIEDVCRAEARFIEAVAALHPNSGCRPALIGNCQAGWQIMMTSAIRPDLPGPILLVGSPLSYWAGVHGKAPMRYLGGLLGAWLTSLAGDLGCGIFDTLTKARFFMTVLRIEELSADSIREYIAAKEKEKRAADAASSERAREEREKLRQQFETEEVPADALQHILSMVQKAVDRGEREVMVMHFPASLLPDSGRRINNGDKDWPRYLSGFAGRAYKFYESTLRTRGFELSASVIDFPGGKPGDIGFSLRW